MTLDLKFFYLGNQCPHNCYLLARIKTLAWQEWMTLACAWANLNGSGTSSG